MKKLLALVVTVLALAGLTAIAYADVTIFKDSAVYPFANWQGANQANYGTTTQPNTHSITDGVVISPFSEPGNYVIKIDFDMSTLASPRANEAWSGHLMTATPGASLVGVTQFNCRVRQDSLTTGGNPIIDKIVTSNSSAGLINVQVKIPVTTGWTPVTSDAGAFAGVNMSAVPIPFGIYMTASDNTGISNSGPGLANHVVIYIDDIVFTGGSSGAVRVTMTSGVVGVNVENTINFDLIAGGLTTNASYNSASIDSGSLTSLNNHFKVTNIGSLTDTADYDLSLVNPGGWTAINPGSNAATATLTVTDTYAIWGVFNSGVSGSEDAPPAALTDYGVEDVITTALNLSTGTVYTYPGATGNGVNVLPGVSGVRNLWIALHTPPLSTTSSTQQIMIGVTALKH